jgi:hypothetical protein
MATTSSSVPRAVGRCAVRGRGARRRCIAPRRKLSPLPGAWRCGAGAPRWSRAARMGRSGMSTRLGQPRSMSSSAAVVSKRSLRCELRGVKAHERRCGFLKPWRKPPTVSPGSSKSRETMRCYASRPAAHSCMNWSRALLRAAMSVGLQSYRGWLTSTGPTCPRLTRLETRSWPFPRPVPRPRIDRSRAWSLSGTRRSRRACIHKARSLTTSSIRLPPARPCALPPQRFSRSRTAISAKPPAMPDSASCSRGLLGSLQATRSQWSRSTAAPH